MSSLGDVWAAGCHVAKMTRSASDVTTLKLRQKAQVPFPWNNTFRRNKQALTIVTHISKLDISRVKDAIFFSPLSQLDKAYCMGSAETN